MVTVGTAASLTSPLIENSTFILMAAKSIVDSVQFCWFWFQQLQIRVQLDEQSLSCYLIWGRKDFL